MTTTTSEAALKRRIAYLEDVAMPHARVQENANGFQKGWHAALSSAGEHAEDIDTLRVLVPEPCAKSDDTPLDIYNIPVWRCDTCGCLWRDNLDNTVSLFDAQQKSCKSCEQSGTHIACKIFWLKLTRISVLTDAVDSVEGTGQEGPRATDSSSSSETFGIGDGRGRHDG